MTFDDLLLVSRAAMPTPGHEVYENSLVLMKALPESVKRHKFAPRGAGRNQEPEEPSVRVEEAGFYFRRGYSEFAWKILFPHWKDLGYGDTRRGKGRFPTRFVFRSEANVRFLAEAATLLLEVAPLVPEGAASELRLVKGPMVSYTQTRIGLRKREGHWTIAEHQKVGEGLIRVEESILKDEEARQEQANTRARAREQLRRMGLLTDPRTSAK